MTETYRLERRGSMYRAGGVTMLCAHALACLTRIPEKDLPERIDLTLSDDAGTEGAVVRFGLRACSQDSGWGWFGIAGPAAGTGLDFSMMLGTGNVPARFRRPKSGYPYMSVVLRLSVRPAPEGWRDRPAERREWDTDAEFVARAVRAARVYSDAPEGA